MTTLDRKLIFTSVHIDNVIRTQNLQTSYFHSILPKVIHKGSVNLRMTAHLFL